MSDDERRSGWVMRGDFDRAFDRIEDRLKESDIRASIMSDNDKVQHGELHEILIKQEMMLESVTDLLKKHDAMLIGKEGRGGLVADTNEIKTGLTIIKWLTGIVGGGVASGIAHLYSKITGGH